MKSTATTSAIILAALSTTADGFSLPPAKTSSLAVLNMAKGGKGFGATPPPPPPPKKKTPASAAAAATTNKNNNTTPTKTVSQAPDSSDAAVEDESEIYNPFDKSNRAPKIDTSRGKAALEKMRREKAEQRNAELQKMQEVVQQDQLVRETGGEAAVIPEKVAQRMGKRMLPFVGIPLFGSMGAFAGFWYMATYRDMEFQPVLVAGTTIALLLIGLVGITYSMMSASWDPEREGSVLGTDEFSRNIENIKDGLGRSRDNAQVREQMMLEDNMNVARQQQQQQQAQAKEKKQKSSLAEKMRDDLE